MAAITLIDADRQWFKSRVGLSMTETARAVSFCTHAIQSRDLFIVPDARHDVPALLERLAHALRVGHVLAELCRVLEHLCVVRPQPRKEARPRRVAQRELAVPAVEANALRGQFVEVRRLTHLAAVAAERVVREIVRDDEQHVHLFRSDRRRGTSVRGGREKAVVLVQQLSQRDACDAAAGLKEEIASGPDRLLAVHNAVTSCTRIR